MSKIGQTNPSSDSLLKVGITGGIGSGKTTVCRMFEQLGVPVYYADERAKAIMAEDKIVIKKIIALFGPEAYQRDGRLNRAYIASVVFHDKKKLGALNAIVHPAVFEDGERWHAMQAGVPFTLKEAALLFESGGNKLLDQIITVSAPEDLRIQRVMERDGVSKEAVLARMKNQMSDDEKSRLADFVILNDGQHSLVRQVWQIHQELLVLASKK